MSDAKRILSMFLGAAVALPLFVFLLVLVWHALAYAVFVLAGVGGLLVLGVIGVGIRFWQWSGVNVEAKRIENSHKTRQLELVEAELQMVQVATVNGFNIKRGDFEISNPYSVSVVESSARRLPTTEGEMQAIPQLAPTLPGPCDFAELLSTWRPSANEILLALAPGGKQIVIPVKQSCHVALAGATGGGKSVLMRLLLAQFLYVGASVILVDPHFAPVDPESGEDWRPIANRLYMPPVIDYTAIKDILYWFAEQELPNRLEKRRAGQHPGQAFFLALDELPAIIANVPEAPDYLAKVLREGRKVGLFLVTAAQDFLVKTIGGSGAVRDCFRTAFYVGGDVTTARVLLDVRGTVDDGGLGKGIVMLRSMVTQQASKVRVPYVSNEALYELLPTANDVATSPDTPPSNITSFSTARRGVAVGATALDTQIVETKESVQLDARTLRIRELVRSGMAQSKIIEEIWGVSAKTGGTQYMKAARELSEIMAKLV